ncbi:Protein PAC2 [Pseudozyma hubeiensis]|nr:Protein PAC2 [Pseudozyma hubeiensis]
MNLDVGRRISLGPHKGTIRYRGLVPPSAGEWLGVEWDDPTRGKHDGTSADGTRHFHVRIPGSGSFIRPTSSKLSSGCSFLSALRNKYCPATEPSAAVEQSVGREQQYSRKNIADIEIETPNLDRIAIKSARLDRLKEVGLGGWNYSSLSDADTEAGQDARFDVARAYEEGEGEGERDGPGSIGATCPNIRWLDLSRSLLPDWEEVSLIAGEFRQLKTLLLHFNRLQSPPEEIPVSWGERLGHIQDLRLDGTLMQWSEVVRLEPALKGLRSLHIGSNEIVTLVGGGVTAGNKDEVEIFPSLTSLSLEDNGLESWPDLVAALSALPSLETLILDRNRITHIPPATATSAIPKLSKLKELHLRGNRIDAWSSLENIAHWLGPATSLEALHISDVPLEEDAAPSHPKDPEPDLLSQYEYRDFRALAIARLPTLKILDKTEITPKERRDAELFVYTRFREADAYIIQGGISRQGTHDRLDLSNQEKAERFPRFLELAKVFDGEDAFSVSSDGVQGERGKIDKKKNTLRSKMLRVSVVACAAAPDAIAPHVVGEVAAKEGVQVLASTPLRLLKIKLASAVGVKVAQVGAVWALMKQRNETEGGEERIVLELDDMSRSLDWYEVASGDSLVLVVDS